MEITPTPAAISPSTAQRSATYRKIAWRLLPFIMACYTAAFLDRVNIGFAKLTMLGDLGMSEAVFGLGAGVFFIGYFVFEVPSNMYMHKIGAKATISRIMVLWGLVSASFMFVTTPVQFYVLRFLLGAAEAGFYPGIILFLTYWFPSQRRARIFATFICAIPLAGLIGGPLSGWVLQSLDNVHGLAGWKWLFLIEAVPSLALGTAAYWFLDNSPRQAKWLTEGEKNLVIADLEADLEAKVSFASHSLTTVIRDKFVGLLVLVVFFQALGQYGLSFWLPTLIKQAGVEGVLNIGMVTAIPYAFAIAAMLLVSRSSDRRLERRWHLIIPFAVGSFGLASSAALGHNTLLAMAALCIAAAGVFTVSSQFWNLPPAFLSGSGAAGGIALINSFGSLAGFVSPFLLGWVKTATGSTNLGIYIIAAALIVGALLTRQIPARVVNR